MANMPSEQERLDRIARNVRKLDPKRVRNLKKSVRGAEIIRHATGTASGQPRPERPQDRVKVK
jgi:hypothetical protein